MTDAKSVAKCTSMWMAVLTVSLVVRTLLSAIVHSSKSSSSYSFPNRGGRRVGGGEGEGGGRYERQRRSLQSGVDGITACADCVYADGYQCVGRTVQDENCDPCSRGQAYWPCDAVDECWCWDTSQPRAPPTDEDGSTGGGGGDLACMGCGAIDTEECVGNQNSLTPVSDEDCAGCMTGSQGYWPCDDPDLCWCWDNTKPKQPPAPGTGLEVVVDGPTPCELLTEEMFLELAPNATFPYTYDGLCDAIDAYNLHHTEKFCGMGNEMLIRSELAAFLGNTAHESDDFEAGREYLACGDRKEVDGKVYCKPCNNDLYDWINNVCEESMVALNSPYNSYCQPSFLPPEGCACDTITQVEEEGGELAGYVEASKVFYGRGAIQLSWNYNYIRASVALTGNPETFCLDPEQVATTPEYAWGTGIYFWMENVKEGWTCHKEIMLNEDFGGTLSNINGGLECPAYKGGWHHSAIKMRLNRFCHAASLLGMTELSSLDGCSGMSESFEECLADGKCPYCEQYAEGLPTNSTGSTESESAVDDGSEELEESVPTLEPAEASTPTSSSEIAGSSTTNSPTLTLMPTTIWSRATPSPPLTGGITMSPTITGEGISAAPSPSLIGGITTSPSITGEGTISPSQSDGSIYDTNAPTVVASSNATAIETSSPTISPAPSLARITAAPTSSEPSTTAPTATALPSLIPTTPPLGECEGESCPANMCRSQYGFCGGGPTYCTEDAIWTPKCPEKSVSPTSSFLQTDEDDSVTSDVPTPILDSVTYPPAATNAPSPIFDSVTDSPFPEFHKPSGGGKKPGGNPKPPSLVSTGSPQFTDEVTDEPTNTLTFLVSAPSSDADSVSPTQSLTETVYTPTDPEASFFCGLDWEEANASCSMRCPSSKSEDCDEGYSCFAFTTCMDLDQPASLSTTVDNEGEEYDDAPATDNQSTLELTPNDPKSVGCTGSPCPFVGECRSQYGFCGSQFIYCNDMSSWKLDDCGLSGTDEKGDPVLCDPEVFECPEGEEVYRDPSNKCEFFPCPVDELEASEETSSAFNLPGSSPSEFPKLPMPTLPMITQAKPFTSPSSSEIVLNDTNTTALPNNNIVIVGTGGEVADDGDETSNTTETATPSTGLSDFNSPQSDALLRDWLESSADTSQASGHLLALLTIAMVSVLAM